MEGFTKLIHDLPNGKLPEPGEIKKLGLLVNVEGTTRCLAIIYKAP